MRGTVTAIGRTFEVAVPTLRKSEESQLKPAFALWVSLSRFQIADALTDGLHLSYFPFPDGMEKDV